MVSDELLGASTSSLDFASLTPADRRTARGVQMILDDIHDQKNEFEHHKKFVRANAGLLAATRSPTFPPFSPGIADLSEDLTTEADMSDDEDILPYNTTCYVLSLDETNAPFGPAVGYWFGRGEMSRYPGNGGVDVLLPPGNFENSTSTAQPPSNSVYARHGYFAFNPKHGQFWLHARHGGIRVDDRPMLPRSKILLNRRTRISIGPHRFIFEFKVSEEAFQVALRRHVLEYHGEIYLNGATSATPSANDVHIDDWILHGVIGASPTSVIHAASHMRSGEVVAVKRLRYGSSQKKAEMEVKLYDEILQSIRNTKYNVFVMQKRDVLETKQSHVSISEVYLLWTPLARLGDFSQLGINGQWFRTSQAIKKVLFVQVTLGLSALHGGGWIHRDLKPANLGIVELGEAPRAVIIDEGSACRQKREGHKPRIGACGTVGYLAPELENVNVAPSYGNKVDIWSLGAVAYFIFVAGRIPWSLRFNMFVPLRNSNDPTLEVFREARNNLLLQPQDSIESLIAVMLEENPCKRPDIHGVLAHPALRDVRDFEDARLEAAKGTGQKRSQAALES